MSRKRPTPGITHTEVLNYAIQHLETYVGQWRLSLAEFPDCEEKLAHICEEQLNKIEILKQLYRIETGVDYYT